jgi:hypothetical protein
MPEEDYFPLCRYTRKPTRRELFRCSDGTIMLQVVRVYDGEVMHAHRATAEEQDELSHTLRGGKAAQELPVISVRKRTQPTPTLPAFRVRSRKP